MPETVTGPTNAPLVEPAIDILVNVWLFFTKNVEPKLAAVTVESVGVPISNTSPSTTPKNVSDAAGFDVKVICDPVIIYAFCGS